MAAAPEARRSGLGSCPAAIGRGASCPSIGTLTVVGRRRPGSVTRTTRGGAARDARLPSTAVGGRVSSTQKRNAKLPAPQAVGLSKTMS